MLSVYQIVYDQIQIVFLDTFSYIMERPWWQNDNKQSSKLFKVAPNWLVYSTAEERVHWGKTFLSDVVRKRSIRIIELVRRNPFEKGLLAPHIHNTSLLLLCFSTPFRRETTML